MLIPNSRRISIPVVLALLVCLFQGSIHAENPKPREEDAAPTAKRTAVILPFKEQIDLLSGALLQRKFEAAVESGVDVIIFDIHSPGGATLVTFELMDMVRNAKNIETVAYIGKDAISGAALLSLSMDTILMKPDARIGDAGEIVMGEDGVYRYTPAKSRSILAQKVRDTADATGRPIALAEKMTDKDMVVFEATHKSTGEKRFLSDKELAAMEDADDWDVGKPIREAGKDMFFVANGRRAVELGIADQLVSGKADLARVLNVQSPIPEEQRSWVDTFVLLLNMKFFTFLLLLAGLTALALELSAPGLGVGGFLSLLCFGLFFWSRFLGGTSGWLEVLLFVIGLLCIAAEIFVIPGFGVAGILGLALMLGSLVMASDRFSMPGDQADWTAFGDDLMTVLGAFLAFLVAAFFLTSYMGKIPGLSRLTLHVDLAPEDTYFTESAPTWQRVEIGQAGTTVSPLRPSGRIQVDDMLIDVVSEGDYVDVGQPVQVIAKQGNRVVVRVVT